MEVIYSLMTTFSDWLTSQMRERNISPAELSRLIKKDQSVVSRLLNSERSPANETLEAIARALKLPPEIVFRAAGILPPKAEDDEWVEKQSHKMRLLSSSNRVIAEKILDTLLEESKPKIAVGKTVKSAR